MLAHMHAFSHTGMPDRHIHRYARYAKQLVICSVFRGERVVMRADVNDAVEEDCQR